MELERGKAKNSIGGDINHETAKQITIKKQQKTTKTREQNTNNDQLKRRNKRPAAPSATSHLAYLTIVMKSTTAGHVDCADQHLSTLLH